MIHYIKIFISSIISGFPLGILYSSLLVWLSDNNVDLVITTSFLIVRIPYSLKFLWGNIIEYFTNQYIRSFGNKKFWMIVSVSIMSVILLCFASISDFANQYQYIYILSIIFAIISAIYDTGFESLRLEFIQFYHISSSKVITSSSLGHKVGFLVSSVGTLLCAHYFSWKLSFSVAAIFYFLTAIYIYIAIPALTQSSSLRQTYSSYLQQITSAYKEFSSRKYYKLIFASVMCLKTGKTLFSSTLVLYYSELKFAKTDIAFFGYFYDFLLYSFGISLSYYLIKHFGFTKMLVTSFLIQALFYPVFIFLKIFPEIYVLLLITTIDSIISGMSNNIYFIYLNELVDYKFITIQYSFLVSLSNIVNNILAFTMSGLIINFFGWSIFFIFVALISFPGIITFLLSKKHDR